MENPEGVLNLLDEFAKVKSKEIPNDLEEYLLYVAASGDPVYQWSLIKSLYRQKLINVITEFYETCPMMDIPACPNVDPFNYETMKNSLLERLDSFASAPFTIQRISELLTTPTKQYNRVDKFMRAIEKNIWVVSTREPGQREPASSQEASGNLVNGVAPRVRVTVKHPKRGKSIEERIKSGHPQLIDDDEEEEEEDESMEAKTNSELLTNNDSEDTPLQCTSVKDLLEKYENGTIFCGTEEKTVQLEESAISGDTNSSSVSVTRGSADVESSSEQESDEEEVNIDKLVTSDECPKIELVQSSEGDKLEGGDSKDNGESEIPIPLVEVVKDDSSPILSESCPPESSNFCSDVTKPDTTDRTDESSSSNEDAETVTVMEVLGLENEVENNDSEPILEEPDSEESVNVTESSDDKGKEEINEAEVKGATTNEAEAAVENEINCEAEEKRKAEDEDDDLGSCVKKLDSNIVVELEADSSSPDDANADVPILSGTIDFIVKEAELDKGPGETEPDDSESKDLTSIGESCTSTDFESFAKGSEFAGIAAELCLQSDLLEAKMEENELEEKSSEMIVEESDKMDEMEVDESNTSSPMVEEEVLEPMDESDPNHS